MDGREVDVVPAGDQPQAAHLEAHHGTVVASTVGEEGGILVSLLLVPLLYVTVQQTRQFEDVDLLRFFVDFHDVWFECR